MIKTSMIKRNTASYKLNMLSCYLLCIWMTWPYFRVRAGVIAFATFFIIWFLTSGIKWISKRGAYDLIFVLVFFTTFIPYLILGSLKYGALGPKTILVNFPLFFVGIYINHYYMHYKRDYIAISKITLVTMISYTLVPCKHIGG